MIGTGFTMKLDNKNYKYWPRSFLSLCKHSVLLDMCIVLVLSIEQCNVIKIIRMSFY